MVEAEGAEAGKEDDFRREKRLLRAHYPDAPINGHDDAEPSESDGELQERWVP